jgi:hypothetical protein
MDTFLDSLSIYNAKAAAAITLAASTGDSGKANLMSSLKSTANDTSLAEAVRLNALTALINVGNLLDVPLPPYFPITTTFANSQTYVGVHNDLSGLNVGDFQHLSSAEKSAALSKASLSDITFTNLLGIYTDNPSLVGGFALKQDALSGLGYVKASGGTITYDNSTFLTSVTGIVAADTPGGGQLTGTYASPTLSNAAVIAKVLTGFNPSASTGVLSSTDSIFSAIEKLNANVNDVVATSGTINEITFALPSSVFNFTAGPYTSGAVPLSGTFINQSQNYFFAGPSGGGAGTPSFRAIVAGDFPVSGATAGSYGSASSIPVVTVDTYGRVTNISSVVSASGGQVNTITYSVPAGVFTQSVTGTSAVSITLGLSTQTANRVWAGPTSGAAAGPTFRSLVALDIPSIAISQVTNLKSELDSKMTFLLNDGEIWIGNASNAPVNKSLTGDITMTRDGVVTIEDEAVTFAKMQDITSGNILGRWDASTPGVIQQISLSADFDLDSGTGILSLAVPVAPILNSKGGLITYRQSIGQQVQLTAVFDGNLLITDTAEDDGLKWVTAQGDIEVDGALDGTFNITAGAVTLGKMAALTQASFLGSNASGPYPVAELTPTVATSMLNQFTTSLKGLAPGVTGPAVGDATYFLNATGAWSQPAGGGGTTTNALTIGSGLSGTAATFNGSAAVTISLNVGNANTWTALQTFTAASGIYLGEAGTSSGNLRFRGTMSGYVQFTAPASPTNQSYILPTATGTTGQFLKLSDAGTGQLAWDTAGSGSGTVISGAIYNLAYYSVNPNGTTVSALGSLGTSAQVLHGNASGIPTWSAVALASDVSGTLPVANGGTGATTLTGLLRGTGTTAIGGGATVALGSEVSGTLVVANGGTGVATNTAYAVLCGGTTTTGAIQSVASVGTSGQVLTSNGAGALPTFQTLSTTATLTNLGAATASNTPLTNAAGSIITWNWNSNTTTNSFVLGSTGLTTGSLLAVTHTTSAYTGTGGIVAFSSTGITSGNLLTLGISGSTATSAENLLITNSSTANTSGRGLDISITGATNSGNTFGAFISNTKTGTTSTNTALSLTASGGTTNYALDVTAGSSRFAAGTASIPQIILTPSSAITISGTVNGSIWYDTASSNSSLTLYKDAAYTKIITQSRNPDFATGSASGVIISDTSGTLTKSADLTALGIFAAYDSVTIPGTTTAATTMVSGSLVGSKTLPANFFAVGKTIEFRASGMFTLVAARTLTLRVSISSLNIDIVIDHGNLITNRFFDFLVSVTCKAISGSNSTYIYTIASNAVHDANGGNILFGNGADSGSLAINTASTIATDMLAFFDASDATDTITIYQASAQYLN